MSNTALSKAPRCSTHTPMSAILICTACNSYLCRLCVTTQRGADVCSSCNGELRRLTSEELGQAARQQTDIMRRGAATTIPIRSGGAAAQPAKIGDARPASKAAAPLRNEQAPPEADSPPPAPPGSATTAPAAAPADEKTAGAPTSFERKPPYFCKKHEKVKATRSCAHCSEYYCNGCAKMIEDNPRCPDCGGQIVALLPEVQNFPPRTIGQDVHDALLFPFKGSGKIMLVLGTVFMFALHFAGARGKALAAAYMYVYGMKICRSSATGREAPPEWPALGDLFGAWYFFLSWLVSRIPAFIVLVVICAASPVILLGNGDDSGMGGAQQAEEDDDNSGPLPGLDNQDESMRDKAARKERERAERDARRRKRAAAQPNLIPYHAVSLMGDLYMPMALLALILFRTYGVLNPLFVFGSIQRVGIGYLATFVTITAAHIVNVIPEFLAKALEGTIAGIFIVPFVSALCFLYLLMVSMRALGVMYYYNQKKLGWFT